MGNDQRALHHIESEPPAAPPVASKGERARRINGDPLPCRECILSAGVGVDINNCNERGAMGSTTASNTTADPFQAGPTQIFLLAPKSTLTEDLRHQPRNDQQLW